MKNMNLQLPQPQHILSRIIKKKITPSHCNKIIKPNQKIASVGMGGTSVSGKNVKWYNSYGKKIDSSSKT